MLYTSIKYSNTWRDFSVWKLCCKTDWLHMVFLKFLVVYFRSYTFISSDNRIVITCCYFWAIFIFFDHEHFVLSAPSFVSVLHSCVNASLLLEVFLTGFLSIGRKNLALLSIDPELRQRRTSPLPHWKPVVYEECQWAFSNLLLCVGSPGCCSA